MLSVTEKNIIRYFQSQASTEEIEILNQWLAGDKRHMEFFCQLQKIWNSKKQMTEAEVNYNWSLFYQAHQKELNTKQTRTLRLPVFFRYAAAIIVGIMFASVWFMLQDRQPMEKVQNMVYNNQGVQRLTLPDSTVIWLHAGSRISYPESFAKDTRTISLEGKAFFEVKKNGKQPLIVQSSHVNVEVTGTEFDMEAFEGNDITVSLVSGNITVKSNAVSAKSTGHLSLTPGYQVVVDHHNGLMQTKEIDVQFYKAWKDGTYRFSEEPIENIVSQLSQKFNVKIHIDPVLMGTRFTGRIPPSLHIKDVMDIFQASHPISYKIRDSEVYINAKSKKL